MEFFLNRIVDEDLKGICSASLPWSRLAGKRILVTGATGNLGLYITYTLLYLNDMHGHDISVVAMYRNKEKARLLYGGVKNRKDICLMQADICGAWDNIGADYIIHAAAMANSHDVHANPYLAAKVNILGFANVIEHAQRAGAAQILLISSGAVYGKIMAGRVDESYRSAVDFDRTHNAYGMSKQICELLAQTAAVQYALDIRIVRPFWIYGLGLVYKEGKSLSEFIYDAIYSHPIEVKGNGYDRKSYCYIKDAVEGLFFVLLKGESGEAYNISSERNELTLLEAAECISGISGVDVRRNDERCRQEKATSYLGANGKLRKLGWEDDTLFTHGIARTMEWARISKMFLTEG